MTDPKEEHDPAGDAPLPDPTAEEAPQEVGGTADSQEEAGGAAESAAPGEGEAEAQTPEARIEALVAEVEDLKERLLRVSADYQNFQRRSRQNLESAREEQVMSLARALVPVLDHFDRALEVDPASTSTDKLFEGVEMVRSELLRVLSGYGIERVEAERGDPFDPNRHEALMRTEDAEVDSGHVVGQLQPGYGLGEKILRPAQVTLAE